MRLYFANSVYFTFSGTVIIAFFVMIFMIVNKKNIILDYSIPEKVFSGEHVKFSDLSIGAESWEWDFGDNNEKSYEQNPEHVFRTAGDYMVTLRVNDKFSGQKKMIVETRSIVIKRVTPVANWTPVNPKEGEQIRFRDLTPDAISWEWTFGTEWETSTYKQPQFIFNDAGPKTVRLKVSGKDFTGEAVYVINVKKNIPAYSYDKPENKNYGSHVDKSGGSGSGSVINGNIQIRSAEIYNSIHYDLRPVNYHGDNEFNGHIIISGKVELEISADQKKIYAKVDAEFIESGGRGDTKARIDGGFSSGQVPLYAAHSNEKILSIVAEQVEQDFYFLPEPNYHGLLSKSYGNANFVHKIEVIGDVEGKDLPSDGTLNKCLFRIYFNDFKMRVIRE